MPNKVAKSNNCDGHERPGTILASMAQPSTLSTGLRPGVFAAPIMRSCGKLSNCPIAVRKHTFGQLDTLPLPSILTSVVDFP